jgi:triacylglycerol lipase
MWWWFLAAALLLAAIVFAVTVVVLRRRRARRPIPKAPRWPVVLVHGWMGFDELGLPGMRPHYFRGIARHLERRGVVVYRPRLPATGSVPVRAAKLAEFIRGLNEDKVNLVAHSMGGLDARYAISRLGVGDRVASLTTIGTPHRGTPLADLADLRPLRAVRRAVAGKDGGIEWLTTKAAGKVNDECVDDPRVHYGCVVCRTNAVVPGPLLPTHLYVRRRAGSNDGLIPTSSQQWGVTLRELDADHWAQVGWSWRYDATAIYDAIVEDLAKRGL